MNNWNFAYRFWAGDWQPNHIFYDCKVDGIHVNEGGGFFGGNSYEIDTHNEYTPLGEWFDDRPAVLHVFKWPYYVVAWPLYFVVQAIRSIAELFYKPL